MELHDITEFVCTRISHDLAGITGALSNTLDLMADDPSDCEEIVPSLQESAQIITKRLKFFRVAFGLKNAAPKEISALQKIVQDYLDTIGNPDSPIKSVFHLQSISLYKIVLLCMMALSDTFIKGGQIEVTENENGLIFHLSSDFRLSEKKLCNIQTASQGKASEDDPALSAPIFYLKSLLSQADVQMNLTFQEKEAELTIS